MTTDNFYSGNSYEGGTGCPALKGSANAAEESTNCHKQEWMLLNCIVISSYVLEIKHYYKIKKDSIPGQGNRF